jgi:hypothetical protein
LRPGTIVEIFCPIMGIAKACQVSGEIKNS